MEFLVFGLFFCIVVGGIVLALYMDKKRREAWQAVAESMGFSFTPKDTAFHEGRSFRIFTKGSGRKGKNILAGEAQGVRLCMADYQYTTGSGNNSSTHRQTVCIVENPELALPRFALAPEIKLPGFLSNLLESFGALDHDTNFEDDPEFSEAFHLSGDDEEAVRALFTPELRRYFVEHHAPVATRGYGKQGGLTVEGDGDALLLHTGLRLKPEQCEGLMAQAFEVMNALRPAGDA